MMIAHLFDLPFQVFLESQEFLGGRPKNLLWKSYSLDLSSYRACGAAFTRHAIWRRVSRFADIARFANFLEDPR